MEAFNFPSEFRHDEYSDQRHLDIRARRRHRAGGSLAPWLRRDRRHVGTPGSRPCTRPYRRRTDLRGMGLSSKPAGGFDKKTQAGDVAGVLDELKIDRADLVTHDIGNMVGYAFAALYPNRVPRFAVIDAPLPGVGPWEKILKNPLLWHFRFGGPDMERLVEGRERIYLDRFWNEFSANPSRFSEAARTHYSKLYAMPGAMHSGFMQFAAFDQDATDNQQFLAKGKLAMPVLAIGGEKSFGTTMAKIMRFAASNVREGVIPDSGHWIMEENPTATIAMVRAFLDANT